VTTGALTAALIALSVPRDRVVFVQSSTDWLWRAGIDLDAAYEQLLEWTAPGGTLVMPAFPFRGSHEAYLRGGTVFDVRSTPARVGLLNERLRRRSNVKRSLDPDLSVIALGPRADDIVGSSFTGLDPMGPDSPFQRVLESGGVFLGLGVSFNYMALIHVLDARYRGQYPVDIYSRSTYAMRVIDEAQREHTVTKQAMLNAVQLHIKPSEVIQRLKPGPEVFRSLTKGETNFFVWELREWERLCSGHADQATREGHVPCWLTHAVPHLPPRTRAQENDGIRA
jgi:aminoglycoside N3'-acetyltransferase